MLFRNKKRYVVHTMGDPVLREVARPVGAVTPELRQLADRMIEVVQAFEGVGLAAPQVGESIRMVAFNLPMESMSDLPSAGEEKLLPKMPFVVINPEIISVSPDTERLGALAGLRLAVLDPAAGERMAAEIKAAHADGDSVGGIVECMVTGLPAGVGEPIYDSLESRIASLVFSIPAVKGVEFGSGFAGSALRGSENNDPYRVLNGRIVTSSNNSGGICGGISTGMPVLFRAAFKPTPSISRPQASVLLEEMKDETLEITGRHDPCIVPRALPAVEAATAMAVLDLMI